MTMPDLWGFMKVWFYYAPQEAKLVCELLGMSINRRATLNLSLMRLAEHDGHTAPMLNSQPGFFTKKRNDRYDD